MAFVLRILFATGKFVLLLVVILLALFIVVWTINRVVQVVADSLGYEVTDFFSWLRTKLPEKKKIS